MSIDLKTLSIAELEKLVDEALDLIESKKGEALESAKAEIERIAAAAGLSVTIDAGAKTKRVSKKVAAVYRNPNNAKETWAGRGKRPKWVVEALAAGQSLESLKG